MIHVAQKKKIILSKYLMLAFTVPPIKVIVSHWLSYRILRVIHLIGAASENQEINGIIKLRWSHVSFLTNDPTPVTVSPWTLNLALFSP